MARKPKRKMGRYIRGNVDETLALGTLAGRTLISGDFDDAVNERTRISSIIAAYSVLNATPGGDIGPIMVGVAHSDYGDGEIEAFIENTGSWDEGNLVEQREIGKRLIRVIGIFPDEGGAALSVNKVLNDGKPIKTKLNWTLLQAQTLSLWAYNLGTTAFATTDPQVRCQGHVNLWPL